jgi:hypothetical protein
LKYPIPAVSAGNTFVKKNVYEMNTFTECLGKLLVPFMDYFHKVIVGVATQGDI